jgi:hypothetical protein
MIHDRAGWRIGARRAALALMLAALPLGYLGVAAVHAQSIMRTPNLNLGSRVPSLNSRIDPNVGGGATLDQTRTRVRPSCSAAYRNSSGECQDQPVLSANGSGSSGKKNNSGSRRNAAQTAPVLGAIPGELVAEIDGTLTDAQADQLARRHGLTRIESQNFPLIDATVGLFRITSRRATEIVRRELAADAGVRSVQPNFRYLLQDQKAVPTEGDPAQYANAILRLPEAHMLARGSNVTIAVIDSAIDVRHPELTGAIVDSFDALGSKEGPHPHGTAVAGAIVSHARLMGSAPAARILAIRAFGATSNGGESNSFVILKALDYGAAHGAQIVNMSFAGPNDALIERAVNATAAKGVVMVAASGNAGAKSPPLYPAANAKVIAVSATDAQDKLFAPSNRGSYIAVAAPGADIFLPVPDGKYQMMSGTSFSAAYISGIAALMLERNPALKADELRAILMQTAHDLGAPGRDDLFGAGEADAFAAVSAVVTAPAAPVAAAPGAEKVPDQPDVAVTRALNEPPAAVTADKSAAGDSIRPAAQ